MELNSFDTLDLKTIRLYLKIQEKTTKSYIFSNSIAWDWGRGSCSADHLPMYSEILSNLLPVDDS